MQLKYKLFSQLPRNSHLNIYILKQYFFKTLKLMNFYFPTVFIPFSGATVAAGFPSPAEDYTELSLDLNSHLIDRPYTTFCIRVRGNSMEGARVYDGDMLLVDRSISPQNGHIVIGVLDGEFTVKRLRIDQGQMYLLPEHPAYDPIKINHENDFKVWGVVTYVIHKA